MSARRHWSVVLFVLFAVACGNGSPAEPSPGPLPTGSPADTEVLTGQVTDRATSAPLAGASIAISLPHARYATTDSAGHYSLNGLPPPGGNLMVWATAEHYEEDLHYYRADSQDFRLYPIEQIPAGGSTVVTVRPDDSLCGTDSLAPGWGADYVCRVVRIAPTDGVVTVEALPIGAEARPRLVVIVNAGNRRLVEGDGNPVSVRMAGGTQVLAFVALASGSPTTQSFTLTTSMAPR
jgi:hypothetical protein